MSDRRKEDRRKLDEYVEIDRRLCDRREQMRKDAGFAITPTGQVIVEQRNDSNMV